jgi:hypothetical protein
MNGFTFCSPIALFSRKKVNTDLDFLRMIRFAVRKM